MIAAHTDLFKKTTTKTNESSTNIQMNHWSQTFKNIDLQGKKRKTRQWTEAQHIIKWDVQKNCIASM